MLRLYRRVAAALLIALSTVAAPGLEEGVAASDPSASELIAKAKEAVHRELGPAAVIFGEVRSTQTVADRWVVCGKFSVIGSDGQLSAPIPFITYHPGFQVIFPTRPYEFRAHAVDCPLLW